jgi:pyruvate/2-oxoglutarate/acetoin dehydrogenase E1 component
MQEYYEEICRAMEWLGKQEDTFFLGQTVTYPGTAVSNTLKNISLDKRMEFPVNEDMQMGMSLGMALRGGTVPISIFPRWNFLLVATSQIVSHLDKLKQMLPDGKLPKVIIRTGIGSTNPLYPGPQHIGDFTDAFKLMCPNINIVRLDSPGIIMDEYVTAYSRTDGKSTLLVEWADAYDPEWELPK